MTADEQLVQTGPTMRFLGIGEYNSLADMYWRLAEAGHEVRVYVHQPEAHDIYRGMLDRVDSWQSQLDWIKAAGSAGIIIFESAAMGREADRLRSEGFHVVGSSAWGDRLECDRSFGQDAMREAGMQTAPAYAFTDYDAAIAFVRERPDRYVYKLSDSVSASTQNYVGQMPDGTDILALLHAERARSNNLAQSFVLMRHVVGVEVGIGAYFDGHDFLRPACIDWEHKRFFPGDLGELTGEMGTVVSYRGADALFELTLGRMAERFRAARHHGYVNINTIVNADGVWPLEFTCRFGYPGFAICDALHREGWDTILKKMVAGGAETIATSEGFAVGVVVTVPPFPYEYGYAELSKGSPIFFRQPLTPAERSHLHFGEVELTDRGYVTSGSIGYVLVVTGVGAGVAEAQRDAYGRVGNIVVKNMRYRIDIGDRLRDAQMARLTALGYFPEPNVLRR